MPESRAVSDRPSSAEPALPPSVIARARAGDPAALAAVFRRHAPELLAVATRLTASRDEAADVVQDLFVGLPEALAHYRERGQFGAWLRRAAVRLALTRLRAARRRRDVPADAPPSAAARAEPVLDRIALERAIGALPESLRVVFVLREVEGYSHAEIAAALGITRAASEVRLFRAVRRLRDALV